MHSRLLLSFVAGAALGILVGGPVAARRGGIGPEPVARSHSGVIVEEIRAGGSCVVVVQRAGSGTSDFLAAVLCTR